MTLRAYMTSSFSNCLVVLLSVAIVWLIADCVVFCRALAYTKDVRRVASSLQLVDGRLSFAGAISEAFSITKIFAAAIAALELLVMILMFILD